MAISWDWGSNGVGLGVEWSDPVSPSPAGGQSLHWRILIDRGPSGNISDSMNSLSWSGAVSGSRSNVSLSGGGHLILAEGDVNIGAGGTASLSATFSGVERAGRTLSVSQSKGVPYALPPQPTSGGVEYIDDRRADVYWSGAPASGAPWQSFSIDRESSAGTIGVVGGLPGGGAWAWRDSSLTTDERYYWTIYAWNSAGASAGRRVGPLYTTPAAASNVRATKDAAGDVTVAWTRNARWGSKQWVEDSTDGGLTFAKVSVDLSGTATSWLHDNPSVTTTHIYRVVAETPNVLRATSGNSLPVQLLAPPNRPTPLGPTVSALGEAIVLTWRHESADGTPQKAYQLRHRAKGATTWTTLAKVTSSTSAHTLAATVYPSAGEVDWEVMTWGQHATGSPWSDTATTKRSARPTAGFTTPGTSGAWGRSSMLIEGTYHDPEGTPVQSWRLRLKRGTQLVQSWSGSGLPIRGQATRLADATSYTVELEVQDGDGLWSAVASRTQTVSYPPPAMPVVQVTYNRDRAEAVISISNPATGPTVVENEVYHQGRLIGEIGAGGSMIWRTVPLSGAAVTVRAISGLPSSIETPPIPVPLPEHADLGIHLNAGPGYGYHAALWGGAPTIDWQPEPDVDLTTFAGDPLPSATYGDGAPFKLSLSANIFYDEPDSSREHWMRVIRARTTVVYRDPVRTLYGTLTGAGFSESYVRWGKLSITFTETMSDFSDLFDFHPTLIEDPPGSGEYRIISVDQDVDLMDLLP